jgi:hypothetical protein
MITTVDLRGVLVQIDRGLWADDLLASRPKFADVEIVQHESELDTSGWSVRYPVVTPYVSQVMGVFRSVIEQFWDDKHFGMYRHELCDRLGIAANWYTAHNPNTTDKELQRAIVAAGYEFGHLLATDPSELFSPMAQLAIDGIPLIERPNPLMLPSNPDEVQAVLDRFRK